MRGPKLWAELSAGRTANLQRSDGEDGCCRSWRPGERAASARKQQPEGTARAMPGHTMGNEISQEFTLKPWDKVQEPENPARCREFVLYVYLSYSLQGARPPKRRSGWEQHLPLGGSPSTRHVFPPAGRLWVLKQGQSGWAWGRVWACRASAVMPRLQRNVTLQVSCKTCGGGGFER